MTNEIENRWDALAAQFAPSVPTTADAIDDEVRPGQLREAIWEDCEATVLIIDVDEVKAEVIVNPVSLEPGVADAHSVVLGPRSASLQGGVAIWPSVEVTLSFVVLDHTVSQLPEDAVRQARGSLPAASAERSWLTDHSPRFGVDPLPGSGAQIAIDELLESIDTLSAVRPTAGRDSAEGKRPKFPLGLSELMATLGITQSEAMSVIRGKRALAPDHAEAVARAAGVPVADVIRAAQPLPDDLERELLEPRWRAVIRQRSGSRGEAAAREELGRSAFALAARAKGQGRDIWRQRIQAVLAAESA